MVILLIVQQMGVNDYSFKNTKLMIKQTQNLWDLEIRPARFDKIG